MKKVLLMSCVIFLGFGCTQKQPENNQAVTSSTNNTMQVAAPTSTPAEVLPKKLEVQRSFTIDEIEAQGNGGVKEWFRQLARANVAGKKTLVRVPVNQVWGFGCLTPTRFCVSTNSSGCYGPFVDLKGKFSQISTAAKSCLEVCDITKSESEQTACTAEFIDNNCSALWEVEGYVVAATRLPEATDDGSQGGTCADGELVYDFEITKVISRVNLDTAEEFKFIEYK